MLNDFKKNKQKNKGTKCLKLFSSYKASGFEQSFFLKAAGRCPASETQTLSALSLSNKFSIVQWNRTDIFLLTCYGFAELEVALLRHY